MADILSYGSVEVSDCNGCRRLNSVVKLGIFSSISACYGEGEEFIGSSVCHFAFIVSSSRNLELSAELKLRINGVRSVLSCGVIPSNCDFSRNGNGVVFGIVVVLIGCLCLNLNIGGLGV